jgi:hypothetical protein
MIEYQIGKFNSGLLNLFSNLSLVIPRFAAGICQLD